MSDRNATRKLHFVNELQFGQLNHPFRTGALGKQTVHSLSAVRNKTWPGRTHHPARCSKTRRSKHSEQSKRKRVGWGLGEWGGGGEGGGGVGDEEPALQTQPQTCIEILWEAARFAPSLQWSAWCRMTPSGWLIPPPPPHSHTLHTHRHTRTHTVVIYVLGSHSTPTPSTLSPSRVSLFFLLPPSTVQLFKTAQQNLTQQRGSSKLPVLQWGIPPFCHCLGPTRSVLCRHFTERKKKEEGKKKKTPPPPKKKKGGGGGVISLINIGSKVC